MGSTFIALTTESAYSIKPSRVTIGTLMTSLNGPGCSITLLNISNSATTAKVPVHQILSHLDAPTEAIAWPSSTYGTRGSVTRSSQLVADPEIKEELHIVDDLKSECIKEARLTLVEPSILEGKLRQACFNMVACEPDLTVWDTEMGDGDCGETVAAGAKGKSTPRNELMKGLLRALDEGVAKSGSILSLVHKLVDIVENTMGYVILRISLKI